MNFTRIYISTFSQQLYWFENWPTTVQIIVLITSVSFCITCNLLLYYSFDLWITVIFETRNTFLLPWIFFLLIPTQWYLIYEIIVRVENPNMGFITKILFFSFFKLNTCFWGKRVTEVARRIMYTCSWPGFYDYFKKWKFLKMCSQYGVPP